MIAADDNTSINSNSNSKTNSDRNQERRTVGEELFLVHLSRASAAEPDPADFDRETKAKAVAAAASATKKKAKPKSGKPSDDEDLPPTPGEELWKVHCKRFKGSDDDDADGDEEEAGGTKPEGTVKEKRGIIGSAAARDDERVLHLRNRDVAIH
jgi:hypothetical protein